MGKRNPDLLARGVSPSCRCGQPSEYHTRDVCGPCYRYHTQRLNPEFYAKKLAKWRAKYYADQARHVNRAREWNVKNSDRVYFNRIKYQYGLSAQTYRELFDMQKGRCAICQVSQEDLGARLEVDHCHGSGEPRGLLCGACNRGLGAHEKAGTPTYRWYLEWTPMMRLQKMKTLTDEERALWNW